MLPLPSFQSFSSGFTHFFNMWDNYTHTVNHIVTINRNTNLKLHLPGMYVMSKSGRNMAEKGK
jgi:hypothetical protein